MTGQRLQKRLAGGGRRVKRTASSLPVVHMQEVSSGAALDTLARRASPSTAKASIHNELTTALLSVYDRAGAFFPPEHRPWTRASALHGRAYMLYFCGGQIDLLVRRPCNLPGHSACPPARCDDSSAATACTSGRAAPWGGTAIAAVIADEPPASCSGNPLWALASSGCCSCGCCTGWPCTCCPMNREGWTRPGLAAMMGAC